MDKAYIALYYAGPHLACSGEEGTPPHGDNKKEPIQDRPSQEPVWWGGRDTTWGAIQERGRRRQESSIRAKFQTKISTAFQSLLKII